MQLDKIADERFESHFLQREIEISKKVSHVSIVKLFHVLELGCSTVLVFELCECDLLQYLQQRGALSENVSRRVLAEIVSALSYLHKAGIGKSAKCPTFSNSKWFSPSRLEDGKRVSDFYGIGETGRFRFCSPSRFVRQFVRDEMRIGRIRGAGTDPPLGFAAQPNPSRHMGSRCRPIRHGDKVDAL